MFFITTFKGFDEDGHPIFPRTVGYVSLLSEAIGIVENNTCDLNECYYDFAAIEEISIGLYPYGGRKFFYKFNVSTKKYEKVEFEEQHDVAQIG